MSERAPSTVSASGLRTTFIVNPIAGPVSTRAARRQRIDDFVRRHRIDARIELSRYGGHAYELAAAAVVEGAQLIVSVGGDGTLNEVASALVDTGVIYGMIPTGSGNGLGRDLGLALGFDRALETLLDGCVREIDTGVANSLSFFNVMGLGLDAEIGRRFNLSRRRGFLTYLRLGASAVIGYRPQRLAIESDSGTRLELDAILVTVANSTQYGNNARIAPLAKLDDGRLDLVVLDTRSLWAAPRLVLRLFTGSMHRSGHVHTLSGTRFVIRRAAPGPIHTDGEVHDCGETIEVSVRPRSLRVAVPRDQSGRA
ncbi:YegS/Rv2252/BmrU family lipid kinase [Opitutales bacterium ASA1]|uniref:diacylglycerol/lipid kinase family protein n=1 Tax=Congregicoccus parvus TaxID=3081749 RepID=UPI002B2BB626|nr:YegS/Rv2252/BmrU family lipid kinase [Opitutales bacterium ASA1]